MMALELASKEKAAIADAYMTKVEELKLDMKEIDTRVHALERAVDVIQTRMAMVTAIAALAGAVVGELVIRVATQYLGG